MGYELYLRRKDPAGPLPEPPALEEALRGAGATGAEGALALSAGDARLGVRLARRDGALQGIDLELPFGAPESDFRATLLLGAQLAAKLDLALVDPQLGSEVTPGSAEAAVASWRSANRYAVETAGNVEDARNVLPVEPLPSAFGRRGKLVLAGLGLLVVLYLLFTWLLNAALQAPLKPID